MAKKFIYTATLQVAQKLASIIIYPGSVADEYGAVKVGA